jgi:hypothetical protein
VRGCEVFLLFIYLFILCLKVNEGARGVEYVKKCVENPHLLDCPTFWVSRWEGCFFLGLKGEWCARGWKCVNFLLIWDFKLMGLRV